MNIVDQCKLIDFFPLMVDEEDSSTLYNPVSLEELKSYYFIVRRKKVWARMGGQQSFLCTF
jgi:hypothetical protein